MKKRAKQLTALLMSLTMVFGMVTTSASATEASSSTGDSSSSTTASSSTDLISGSSDLLASYDEETLSAMAEVIAAEASADTSSTTEEEQAIKDEIYSDIFLNTDSAVDVSDYSTDTATMEALTDEVLEENNATDLVTVTYEEDELSGEATIMTVEMDAELAEVVYDVNTSSVYTVLTAEQTQTLMYMYSTYLSFYNENVAYLGRQTAWFTSYEQDDEGDGISPLGSLLVLAGVDLDDVRTGDYTYDEVMGTLMTFYYAYYFGVQFYGEDILAAKDDAMDTLDNSAYRTDAQKMLVLTDWMSNRISFDMGYIINLSSEDEDIMACADPEDNEYYDTMYQTFYQMYYSQMVESYGAQYGAYYADYAAQQMVEGVETMWESCVVGALGLGNAVCLGYSLTFAYLMQWATPEVYAVDGKTLTTDSGTWKTVDELNYITTEKTETVESTGTTWDGVTYYALAADEDETVSGSDETTPESGGTTPESGETTPESGDPVDEGGDSVSEGGETSDEDLPSEDGNDAGTGDAGEEAEQTVTVTEESQTVSDEAAETSAPDIETTTEETNYPYYVWSETEQTYVQATDESGNKLYVVDGENAETTKENTGYPVYITGPVFEDVTTYTKTFSIDSGYVVDIVRIDYDASVTMYGEENEDFNSQHFWNAVKIDGEWYYLDTNYTDIYTEALIRDRVETEGDMNHNYFLFSDTTARSLYSGNYDDILTLYEGVATDTSYEGNSWMYFAGSNVYADGKGKFYYVYDSTDMMGMATSTDTTTMLMSLMSSMFSSDEDEDDTEYKIVYHTFSSSDIGTGTDFTTLIDFNEGTVYNPTTKKLVENELIQELYALQKQYEEQYPSLSLTMAYYDNMVYFNLANCLLSYDISTGEVTRVKEYNEVGAVRDTSKVFAGTGFDVVYDLDEADVVVNNPPIAGISLYDDTLYVDVATNYAWISGKEDMMDTSSYGWEYEQTNYNADYSTYLADYLSGYISMMGIPESMINMLMSMMMSEMGIDYEEDVNDNDEFMWTANFTDALDMSTVTSSILDYEEVSVAATCGRDAFTENRSEEGLIEADTREVEEGTACDHHYVKYDETYYTTDDDGNYNTGTSYVCTICGYCVNEDDNDEEDDADEWDIAVATAGHDYVATEDGIEWAEDYSSASVSELTCDLCGDMTNEAIRIVDGEQETITVASLDCLVEDDTLLLALDEALVCDVEIAEVTGTCDEGTTIVYNAIGPDGSDYACKVLATVTVENEPGNHSYVIDDEDWIWEENADGSYSVTVKKAVCSVCGAELTDIAAEVTENETEYVASVELEGTTYTNSKSVILDTPAVALSNEATGVQVTWDEVDKAKAYRVARRASGESAWTTLEDVTADTVSYTDTDVVSGTTYEYAVYCISADGSYAASDFESKTITYVEPPVISSLSGSASGITVKWNSVDGAVNYRVYRKTGSGSYTKVGDTTSTSYTDDSVKAGTTYTYTVCCISKDAKSIVSAYNSEESMTYAATPELSSVANSVKGVTIKWSAASGAVKYRVYRKTYSNGSWSSWKKVDETTSTSYTDTTVSSGTKYKYTVRCVTSDGSATTSGYDTAGLQLTYIAAPVISSLSGSSSGVTVKWSAVNGAVNYRVFRKASGASSWTKLGDTTSTSFTDKTAKTGTTYTYTVRCINAKATAYTSSYTSGKSITYAATPKLSGVSNSTNGVTVKWSAASGAAKYRVYRKVYSNGSWSSWKKVADTTSTSYKDTTVSSGYKYKYTVRCVTSDGSATTSGYDSTGLQITYLSAPVISSLKGSSSGVTVTWGKVNGAAKYRVFRKVSGGSWVKLADTTSTSYTDKTAKAGTAYTYTVRCINSKATAYTSSYTSGKSITYAATPVLSGVSQTSSGVKVTWKAATGAVNYRVYRKVSGGSWTKVGDTTSTSYVDTTAKAGTTYYYTVRCITSDGSAWTSGYDTTGKKITVTSK